jgi:hypothetical protein
MSKLSLEDDSPKKPQFMTAMEARNIMVGVKKKTGWSKYSPISTPLSS